jgi:hypothetical protein
MSASALVDLHMEHKEAAAARERTVRQDTNALPARGGAVAGLGTAGL